MFSEEMIVLLLTILDFVLSSVSSTDVLVDVVEMGQLFYIKFFSDSL